MVILSDQAHYLSFQQKLKSIYYNATLAMAKTIDRKFKEKFLKS